MHRMDISPLCNRCAQQNDTLLHTLWTCITLETLSRQVGTPLPKDPKLCLLGITTQLVLPSPLITYLHTVFFLARKLITFCWKNPNPPTYEQWYNSVKDLAKIEKAMYTKNGRDQSYRAIWEKWNASYC
ncbi:hypothetical protein XELAEV_18033454mg [Xenopus laevis]|uniref:Uncharacterized protein n=1 Tax=Xenopus laevis TaxID=8355 RepID=A0A974CKS7_XENLA|nr:hypothetical protein XELAEV_18033454mg [Xenopus laevis]